MTQRNRRRQARLSNRSSTVALAAAGILAVSFRSAAAFNSPSLSLVGASSSPFRSTSTCSWGRRETPRRRSTSSASFAASASTTNGVDVDDIPMSPKLESAAVRRFATGYDKLCKNCPTRLKPRVDTLTEMILGLTDDERAELMAAVTKRVEEKRAGGSAETGEIGEGGCGGARTAREVYDFQVGSEGASLIASADKKKNAEKNGMNDGKQKIRKKDTSTTDGEKSSHDELAAIEAKLCAKLSKSRSKLEKSQLDHSRTSHLLTMASLFLSEGSDAAMPPSVERANDCNADVDELRSMDTAELELQKLKYEATIAKCQGKMAKARVKMFASNLELSRVRALRAERMDQEREATIEDGEMGGVANETVATVVR